MPYIKPVEKKAHLVATDGWTKKELNDSILYAHLIEESIGKVFCYNGDSRKEIENSVLKWSEGSFSTQLGK